MGKETQKWETSWKKIKRKAFGCCQNCILQLKRNIMGIKFLIIFSGNFWAIFLDFRQFFFGRIVKPAIYVSKWTIDQISLAKLFLTFLGRWVENFQLGFQNCILCVPWNFLSEQFFNFDSTLPKLANQHEKVWGIYFLFVIYHDGKDLCFCFVIKATLSETSKTEKTFRKYFNYR